AARRYEKLDRNDDPCAIIKVTTDLKSLKFDSNLGIEDVEQKEGEYWLYVSPTEKRLTLAKEGFIKLAYIIPVPVKSSSVYVMVLTRKGGEIEIADKDLFQVVFKLNEAEVFISKDDGAPLKTKGKAALFSLPKGPHQFKFTKEGFADQTQDIQVEKNETITVEMKPGASKERMRLPGIVTIDSDPEGAEVFLNDQKLGETPLTDELIAGEYTLVLRKNLYYPNRSRFTLEEGESKQIPTIVLKPRFATYTIRTTPEDATVYVDGKRLDPASRTKQQIESGQHTIRVEKKDYHHKSLKNAIT
ncbi:MAG TPA: PEGA domain-containing protein, partial [Thiotrichaceae bacterium]|nr:PEGA domain-containing protein [Thiotrichaceae bacterium]